MQNKALHTIFLDSETARSDSPVHTAFADLVPAVQSQTGESVDGSLPSSTRSLEPSNLLSDSATESGQTALPEVLSDVSKNLDRLRAVTEAQITETTANTAALGTNTTTKSVGQAVASVGKAASSFLGGLTSFPLISGLVKLFGGGSDTSSTQAALPKYEAPASLAFDRVVTNGSVDSQIGEPTYDRFGNPKASASENFDTQSAAARLSLSEQAPLFNQSSQAAGSYEQQQQNKSAIDAGFSDASLPDYSTLLANVRAYPGQLPNDQTPGSSTQNLATSPIPSAGTANTTQITVNVQAMDSRSFLDRSQDIAQAVREAMLNMHSINDVVNDL